MHVHELYIVLKGLYVWYTRNLNVEIYSIHNDNV